MNNQVVIKEEVNFDVVIKDVETMQKMCTALMKTKHYQSMGESGLFAIVQKAKSLNLNPLEALNGGLYFVQGRVGMSSEMMASLIRQSGHSIIKDPKSDNTICILHGKRADNGDTWTVSFSMDDARRAGLAKNMYDKYPGIMIYNRAMSMLARQLFPDIIKGAGYTKEELHEIENNIPTSSHKSTSKMIEIQEVPGEVISKEQSQNLQDIIDECSNDYKDSIDKFLIDSYGSNCLSNLEKKHYERMKKSSLQKRDEYFEKQKEQFMISELSNEQEEIIQQKAVGE